MKNSYTTLYFDDRKIEGLFNATLSKDFLEESILGEKSIIEEKIPGRDVPYFYGIDRSPLEFEVILAFDAEKDIHEVTKYIQLFYATDKYVPIAFEREDGFITPIFYGIVQGSPKMEYMRIGENSYVGVIKLTIRCNAPYGYSEGYVTLDSINTESNIWLNYSNMKSMEYYISIKNNGGDVQNLKLENADNETQILFSDVYADESIVIDGRIKRFTGQNSGAQLGVYDRWDRNYIEIGPHKNNIKLTYQDKSSSNPGDIEVEFIYRAPRLL